MDEQKLYTIGFSVFPGIGPLRYRSLMKVFKSAAVAWQQPENVLKEVLGKSLAEKFIRFRNTFSLSDYLQKLRQEKVSVVTIDESKYPQLLREISDPPIALYIKGRKSDPPLDLARTLAVVGTRRMTPYGREITRELVAGLVRSGLTIVSGMAYGIDAQAHLAAIENGGKTIAVLGCGVDIAAPRVNTFIYNKIIDAGHGIVISEMPLSHLPDKGLFPARNRIISGLSLGVVVVEGNVTSGALITAKYAAEQGRDVFCIPGPVTSQASRGPLWLMQHGAKPVDRVEDIISELGISQKQPQKSENLTDLDEDQKCIYSLVAGGPLHIDEIIRTSGRPAGQVLNVLTQLELNSLIRDIGGKVFVALEN
ncbi:DNA protecting protein DprA [Candidatus Gottesmanbacteria bacterium RBG_16_43_7]|uniref:DNA protecting protein DprA n=1 Tax=Candidatus Gottesmanbacteria bacterium RBG_16_43_7 TaxID=1798373 RepID=A0A1F5Z8R8_9BACT|nr:MAG: DNA protecting protein DprA [Candidatus Gottesmanbacteria bacterium RBG_16_43_7]